MRGLALFVLVLGVHLAWVGVLLAWVTGLHMVCGAERWLGGILEEQMDTILYPIAWRAASYLMASGLVCIGCWAYARRIWGDRR